MNEGWYSKHPWHGLQLYREVQYFKRLLAWILQSAVTKDTRNFPRGDWMETHYWKLYQCVAVSLQTARNYNSCYKRTTIIWSHWGGPILTFNMRQQHFLYLIQNIYIKLFKKKNQTTQNHGYFYSSHILFPAILTVLFHVSNQPYWL